MKTSVNVECSPFPPPLPPLYLNCRSSNTSELHSSLRAVMSEPESSQLESVSAISLSGTSVSLSTLLTHHRQLTTVEREGEGEEGGGEWAALNVHASLQLIPTTVCAHSLVSRSSVGTCYTFRSVAISTCTNPFVPILCCSYSCDHCFEFKFSVLMGLNSLLSG